MSERKPAPWQADHELDEAGARDALRGAFPDLKPRSVRYFAEGWDYRMFKVDDAWLFRFPKRIAVYSRLEAEIALLDRFGPDLPFAIPRYTLRAPGVAGYRMLGGLPMTEAERLDAFPASLARFASAVHAIGVYDIPDSAMPGCDDTAPPDALLRDTLHDLEEAKPALDRDLHDRCREAIDVPLPAPFPEPPRLCHNDLYPEHILLNLDGSIRAVIDWGDATRADPAGDFAVAWFAGGDAMLHAAVEGYALPRDGAFEERARWYGIRMAVGHIAYGARAESPEHLERGVAALP